MRVWKLLSTTALAATKDSVNQPPRGARKLDQPSTVNTATFGRRKALQNILGVGAAAVAAPKSAFGLDMETFANSELASDKANCDPKRDPKCIPKLSADEALCKYGQSGNARGEACKRVKQAGGSLPGATKEKSLGGAYAM